MNYQNIRFQLKEMKKNRLESQKRIQNNLGKKVNYKNKNLSSSKYKKINKNNHNSFYRSKSTTNFSNSYNYNCYNKSSSTNNLNVNLSNKFNNGKYYFDKDNNGSKRTSANITEEKNKKNNLKQKLIEKLKEDEKEKKRIEEEIAKIEQEELMLLSSFKNDEK